MLPANACERKISYGSLKEAASPALHRAVQLWAYRCLLLLAFNFSVVDHARCKAS